MQAQMIYKGHTDATEGVPGVQAQPQAVPSFDTPIPPIGKATQTRIDVVPPAEDNPKDDLPF